MTREYYQVKSRQRLDNDQVRTIRLGDRSKIGHFAMKFGVTWQAVNDVYKNKTYRMHNEKI
jgi:hypothetical protein